jgi:4-diphosphocytidyl-2-C-methyl-D-erythritol kinase
VSGFSTAAVEVRCPSKINLFLEVLRRCEDGYHDIDTVMVPGPGEDIVIARGRDESGVGLTLHFDGEPDAAVPDGPANLAVRAALAVLAEAGADAGVHLDLVKGIPSGAGLGGASADAASALLAVNELAGSPLDHSALHRLAASLGSDVPWFLDRRPARARGRGEVLEPLPERESELPLHWLVAFPGVHASTAEVYGRCVPATEGEARGAGDIIEAWRSGSAADLSAACFNRLAGPAKEICPDVEATLDLLRSLELGEPHVTGSGSACFLVLDDPVEVTEDLLQALPGIRILAG